MSCRMRSPFEVSEENATYVFRATEKKKVALYVIRSTNCVFLQPGCKTPNSVFILGRQKICLPFP